MPPRLGIHLRTILKVGSVMRYKKSPTKYTKRLRGCYSSIIKPTQNTLIIAPHIKIQEGIYKPIKAFIDLYPSLDVQRPKLPMRIKLSKTDLISRTTIFIFAT